MSKPTKDGGPAFPTPANSDRPPSQGMTLRDWFAGMALLGMVASPARLFIPEQDAVDAYKVADAMLAAREGKP
jgi:hypothetical protein